MKRSEPESHSPVEKFIGIDVKTSDGKTLGISARIFENPVSGAPEWLLVESGLMGIRHNIVPVAGSELTLEGLLIPYSAMEAVSAPPVRDASRGPTGTESESLNRHFHLGARPSEA